MNYVSPGIFPTAIMKSAYCLVLMSGNFNTYIYKILFGVKKKYRNLVHTVECF